MFPSWSLTFFSVLTGDNEAPTSLFSSALFHFYLKASFTSSSSLLSPSFHLTDSLLDGGSGFSSHFVVFISFCISFQVVVLLNNKSSATLLVDGVMIKKVPLDHGVSYRPLGDFSSPPLSQIK